MKKLIFISIGSIFMLACAHHRDVRPGVDGTNTVIITTDEKEEGSRDAIAQANHFCKEQNKYAAFINEEQKYVGDMDEKNYKTAKTAAKVASAAGGTVWALGGQKESNIGGIVGMGGAIANTAIGKGYTVNMKFQCK